MEFEIKINEKLSLKLRNAENAEAFFNLVDKNREELRKWLPWVDSTVSPKDTNEFIMKCLDGFEKKKSADFGILYENKWIGSMGYNDIDLTNKKAEIGYWLDKDYQGKGIMTDCVRAIIKYGFEELDLHRIEIKCASSNTKSKAVPERLGFTLEGTLRDSYRMNGVFCDTLIFGILRSEWSH